MATQGVQAIRRCKLVHVCQDFLGTRLVELFTNKGQQMRMVASLRRNPHPSDLHRPVKHDIRQARWDRVVSLHWYAAAIVKHSRETMFCKRAKRLRCKYQQRLTLLIRTDQRCATSAKQEGTGVVVCANLK